MDAPFEGGLESVVGEIQVDLVETSLEDFELLHVLFVQLLVLEHLHLVEDSALLLQHLVVLVLIDLHSVLLQ
jgi:hypothetical protein